MNQRPANSALDEILQIPDILSCPPVGKVGKITMQQGHTVYSGCINLNGYILWELLHVYS